MASRLGCKVCSACRCMHQSTGKFTFKSSLHCASQTPPHSCPLSTSEARLLDGLLAFVIVMRPSQGQRCQQYDSQTHSACWSLSLSEMFLYPPPPPPQTLKSVWMRRGSPSCLPPLLPPAFTASFSPLSPQRNSPSFGLPVCSREDWDSSWLWVPERGRESITPIRHSAWNCKVTVETAVFCQGQRCPCLEISHTESPLSPSS